MKRTILALIALLAFCGSAKAQVGRYETYVHDSQGRPLAGVNVSVCSPMATTAASVTNNLVTLTMASNPITAGFQATFPVTVSGFTGGDTYLNGTFTIASVSSTAILFPLTHANASAASNGTAIMGGNTIQACAPLATLYTDNTGILTSPNPFVTDGFGNAGFWAGLSGTTGSVFYVQYYGPTVVTTINIVAAAAAAPVTTTLAIKPQNSDLVWYVSPNGNDSNDGLSMGTAKALASTCLANIGIGGTCVVSGGVIAQGATPLAVTARSLMCLRNAAITFNGLGASTDAVTEQGFVAGTSYFMTVDGCTFITSANGSASGRDILQISGGDHIKNSNLVLLDPGRDAIHVEPGCNGCWIEDLKLDNIKTNTCSAAFQYCTGTVAASGTLRDDLFMGLGEKFSTSLTGIFLNDMIVVDSDFRAHARYGYHWYQNNSCSGCSLTTFLFDKVHTDGAGRVPAATAGNFFEKGASGASGQINGFVCSACGDEDTVTVRSAAAYKASGTGLGQGISLLGYVSFSNFAHLFDVNLPADFANVVDTSGAAGDISLSHFQVWDNGNPTNSFSMGMTKCLGGSAPSGFSTMALFCSNNSPSMGVLGTTPPQWVPFGPIEWAKDTTGTQAGSWGLAIPGNANGNDFICSVFNSGTWTKRCAALQAGGFAFYPVAGGAAVAQVTDAGQVNGTSFATATNCTSNASPAVCGSAAAGAVIIASGGATTIVVDTSAVTANSDISLTFNSALGTRLSVTCNTTAQQPYVTAISPGVSFTITVPAMFTTNPGCITYDIKN